jgi:CAAX protease family protein
MSILRLSYARHERLVAPARAQSELWRLVFGLALGAFVMTGLNVAFLTGVETAMTPEKMNSFIDGMQTATTPVTALVSLASFGFMTAGVCAAAYVMHGRAPLGLIGPFRIASADFWAVLKALAILNVVILALPPWGMDDPLVPNLPVGTWVALLPVSLLVVLIQTSAEEILFRGYVQQQLAARFNSPWVWMVLPSALFGLAHYVPAETGSNAVLIAIWAACFGLLMADLTARSGTLGPAIAVHFATNVSALLVTSLPDTLSGLSLFTVPFSMSDEAALRVWLPVDFAVMVVSWLVARLALRR